MDYLPLYISVDVCQELWLTSYLKAVLTARKKAFWDYFICRILLTKPVRVEYLLPSLLWHCWLSDRKGIWAIKNWVTVCWHGYMPVSTCRFAYGPADATATHYLFLQKIQIGFTFLVLSFWCRLTRVVPDKIQEGRKMVCVYVCVMCVSVRVEYLYLLWFKYRQQQNILLQENHFSS